MNHTELSAAWNDLRNAALGRGTQPTMRSAVLAERIGNAYERWRAYVADAAPALVIEPLTTPNAWAFLQEYRDLASQLAKVIPSFRPVAASLPEKISELPGQLGSGLVYVGAFAVVALVLVLAVKR